MQRATLAVLLALAASAPGQTTEKQALSQAKAAIKAAVATFKAECKEQQQALDARIVLLEAQIDDQVTPSEACGLVAQELVEVLDPLAAALDQAMLDSALGVGDALGALADGGDLAGIYPGKLYAGPGTLLAGARGLVLKQAAKVQAAMDKRLLKFAGAMEKETGLGLTVLVRFPCRVGEWNPNDGLTGAANFSGARLDLVVTASRLANASDGALVAAGLTSEFAKAVTISVGGESSSDADEGDADVNGRFIIPMPTNGSLPEGNYSVVALQVDTVASSLAVGLR